MLEGSPSNNSEASIEQQLIAEGERVIQSRRNKAKVRRNKRQQGGEEGQQQSDEEGSDGEQEEEDQEEVSSPATKPTPAPQTTSTSQAIGSATSAESTSQSSAEGMIQSRDTHPNFIRNGHYGRNLLTCLFFRGAVFPAHVLHLQGRLSARALLLLGYVPGVCTAKLREAHTDHRPHGTRGTRHRRAH